MQVIVLASKRGSGRIWPAQYQIFHSWKRLCALLFAFCSSLLLGSCQKQVPPARVVNLQQTWELEPGDEIAGRLVTGGLGDITIQLSGSRFYAPFDGEVEPAEQDRCVIFSTPEVPAYLFRLCGLQKVRMGSIRAGEAIGSGDYLNFATLRRQPSGTWTIVEPSTGILERALSSSVRTALPSLF